MKKIQITLAILALVVTTSVTTLAFEASLGNLFEDVESDAYYYEAVNDLAFRGILNGYGDDVFGPEDPVTRGQLAAVIYRMENRLVGGYFGDDMDDKTRVYHLVNLVCAGFENVDLSAVSTAGDIEETYDAICVNRHNMEY
jgi:hypothetical protein